jgi:hypothetical protein
MRTTIQDQLRKEQLLQKYAEKGRERLSLKGVHFKCFITEIYVRFLLILLLVFNVG